jgi:hypothetical protein
MILFRYNIAAEKKPGSPPGLGFDAIKFFCDGGDMEI